MKALLLFFFISINSSYSESKILIMTEAQVKGHVITSREVAIHKLLKSQLGGSFEHFKEDSPIEQVIKEWLLYSEASSFYNSKVPSSTVRRKVNRILEKKKLKQQMKALSLGEKELSQKVRRYLEAERLYTFKKKASVLPVTLNEIETEYTENRIRYGSLTFEEAKNKIRQNKIQENLQSRLEQWFLVLESKYKVQRFSKYNKVR